MIQNEKAVRVRQEVARMEANRSIVNPDPGSEAPNDGGPEGAGSCPKPEAPSSDQGARWSDPAWVEEYCARAQRQADAAERNALLAARSIPALITILAHPWEGPRYIENRFVSDGHGCLALDGTTSEKWAKVDSGAGGDLRAYAVADLLAACDIGPDGAGTVSRDGRSYGRLKLLRWVVAPCVATGMDRVAIRFGTKSLKAFGDGWQSMVMIKTCPDNDDRSWPEDVTS